jgi:D-beta-D-heptose 7-phosphate kinase/D-beta-D-heptose 1-phosphate adenosyltransferase
MNNLIPDNKYHRDTLSKIIPDPAILKKTLVDAFKDKKIVLVKGVYDLLHSGHYFSFINAKKYGDILIVAVSSDTAVTKRKGNERPIISEEDRLLMIAALSCVDWVTLYDQDSPYELLKVLKPNVFTASHFDYLSKEQQEELSKSIQFIITPKLGGNSTTKIINKIKGIQ